WNGEGARPPLHPAGARPMTTAIVVVLAALVLVESVHHRSSDPPAERRSGTGTRHSVLQVRGFSLRRLSLCFSINPFSSDTPYLFCLPCRSPKPPDEEDRSVPRRPYLRAPQLLAFVRLCSPTQPANAGLHTLTNLGMLRYGRGRRNPVRPSTTRSLTMAD